MKIRNAIPLILIPGAVLLLGLAAYLVFGQNRGSGAAIASATAQDTATAPVAIDTPSAASKALSQSLQPELAPGSTAFPVPTPFPAAQWSPAPDCASQPAGQQDLARSFTAPTGPGNPAEMDFRRAVLLSPRLASMKAGEVSSLLAGPNGAPADQASKTFLSLAINVATGRLNRATEVNLPEAPEIKTVGDLFDQLESGLLGSQPSDAVIQAAEQVQNGQNITRPVCAHLLVTKNGSPTEDVQWDSMGVKTSAIAAESGQGQPYAMDTVITSPDGRLAAFTSVGNDSGGPVYIRELASGQMANLIDKANASLSAGQPQLPPDGRWEIIGWLPDSQQIMLSDADASAVYLINTTSGTLRRVSLPGAVSGGGMYIGLSIDGSQVAYVAETQSGDGQAINLYNLNSEQAREILMLPYSEGLLLFPRFSPDGKWLAYLVQTGRPETGISYSISLFSFETGLAAPLTKGNLGITVPVWSPDAQHLAFTQKEGGAPDLLDPAHPLDQSQRNVWSAAIPGGELTQLTFLDGQADRPQWASDAKTLSFVTHDGQVGLVSLDQPGKIWQAAPPAAAVAGGPLIDPIFTSAFFIP